MKKNKEKSQKLEDMDNNEDREPVISIVAIVVFFVSLIMFWVIQPSLSLFFIIPVGPWGMALTCLVIMFFALFLWLFIGLFR